METIKYFIRQRSNLSAVKEKMRERNMRMKKITRTLIKKEKERKTHTVDRLKSQYRMKQHNAKKNRNSAK